jgi:hypothetical protein
VSQRDSIDIAAFTYHHGSCQACGEHRRE